MLARDKFSGDPDQRMWFAEGEHAYFANVRLNDCPYNDDPEAEYCWGMGWVAAEERDWEGEHET